MKHSRQIKTGTMFLSQMKHRDVKVYLKGRCTFNNMSAVQSGSERHQDSAEKRSAV